jgi:hypothetical protein
MSNIYLILLIALAFLVRAYPRYKIKYAINFDTYFHLIQAREIRKNKFRIPDSNHQAVLPHVNSYPFLYHFILALLPDKYRLIAERYTGAVFECVNTIIIFSFSKYFFNIGISNLIYAPYLISLLYIFWPALSRSNYGPRAYNGSPRIVAQTFYMIHISAGAIGLLQSNFYFLAISILFGTFLVFTAKFGLQVLAFFSIPFICFFDYKYSYIFALSILFCFILYPKLTLRIIIGYFEFIKFYFKYTRKYHDYLKISKLVEAKKYIKEIKEYIVEAFRSGNGFKRLIHWFFRNNFFIHILLTSHFQFVFLISIFAFIIMPYSPLIHFLWIWTLTGFATYALTNLKILNFLGEPERYLEYATFPSLILLFYYLTNKNYLILYLIMLYVFLFTLYNIYTFIQLNNSRDYFSYMKLFNRLNNCDEGCVWPLVNYWQGLYFSKFPVLSIGNNYSEKYISGEEFTLLYGNYPWPSDKFDEIVNKYKVKYIVASKSMLDYYFSNIVKDRELCYERLTLIIDEPQYCAWKIKKEHE